MEVYDKAVHLIGYVLQCNVRQSPPEEPVQFGDNERETWMEEIAQRAAAEDWSLVQRKNTIATAAIIANFSDSTAPDDVISEAMLATRAQARADLVGLFGEGLEPEIDGVVEMWWSPEVQAALRSFVEKLKKRK